MQGEGTPLISGITATGVPLFNGILFCPEARHTTTIITTTTTTYRMIEVYEGPLDSTNRITDIDGEPLTHFVSVYHSGRSDEPAPKPEEEPKIDIADAAKTFGDKITGLFKRRPTIPDYPTSDEPAPKPEEEQPLDIAEAAKTFGEKITGLFKRGPAHLDYPVSEVYEGPLDSTNRTTDIDGEPLTHFVSVYHSGRSDEPAPKPEEEPKIDIADAAKTVRDLATVEMIRARSDQRAQEPDSDRNKVDLDIHFNIKSQDIYEMQKRQYQDLKQPLEEPPVFLSADNLERDQKPVGFSVSISARQPDDRTSSELFSSLSREPSSDKRYLRDQSTRTERSQKHRLSPHTWTTVRERTEVTYVRKLRVERSVSPRSRSPPRSSFIRRVPYDATATAAERTAQRAYTCRSSNFDERVMVHHPIFPPHQSLYRNGGTYGNGDSRNGHTRTYSPVREVAAFDRTEWIEQHPSYIPPNRRADEIFTVGTPFIMGHVERDGNGCAYLRYQSSGLQERPPLPERLDDLPMIEEGAIECRRATIRATLRDMDTVGLVQDEEELERRRRPIRRVRQRMRSYCTML
ncbi:hypothetical protein ANCCEY_02140 [Ancylostoma ceylanicum]|uniref:Uncharacterized protein n=1 Tax=Ancylostoma ceylanicum TaxID=53326 RepID=A0A0D6M3A3_9BILA|nr:hypothetical protein ANCCEY_02140 [Ancylostoma ceylanicum]